MLPIGTAIWGGHLAFIHLRIIAYLMARTLSHASIQTCLLEECHHAKIAPALSACFHVQISNVDDQLNSAIFCLAVVNAVRITYPDGVWPEHAMVHAAASALTISDITRIWISQSTRSKKPCVGVQFSSAAEAAAMQHLGYPKILGEFCSTLG